MTSRGPVLEHSRDLFLVQGHQVFVLMRAKHLSSLIVYLDDVASGVDDAVRRASYFRKGSLKRIVRFNNLTEDTSS